ncbi:hypothetical protein [Amantichitinum ursilacus]|uniref:Uncharacterized protein n=1 Tax=Amantichitinum ursilacus TaxID=857265 RepID=A0A0N0GPB7_9NEIS|nr:hypothetical protein [Amantichitinum ursilacus]KPC53334.1 hypothetical protein WG78_09600 [Amantichitinum ursilacus]
MYLKRYLSYALLALVAMPAFAADAPKLDLTLPESVKEQPKPDAASQAAETQDKANCADLIKERDDLKKDPIDRETGTITLGRKKRLAALDELINKQQCYKAQ